MQKKERPKTIFDSRYDNIISCLIKIRIEKGFSQRSFSKASGYSRCFINRTEAKERRLDCVEIIDYLKRLGLSKKEIEAKVVEWLGEFS